MNSSLHQEEQLWVRVHVHGSASWVRLSSGSWSSSVDTHELGWSKYVGLSFEPKFRVCLKHHNSKTPLLNSILHTLYPEQMTTPNADYRASATVAKTLRVSHNLKMDVGNCMERVPSI